MQVSKNLYYDRHSVAIFMFAVLFICNQLDKFFNDNTKDFMTLHEFMVKTSRYIFTYFKLPFVFGVCVSKLLYTQWFFLSLFCEGFVIAVSLQLSGRFANVRRKIKRLSDLKIKDENMWLSVREQYGRLSALCAMLSDALGNMTLLVLANNTGMFLFYCYESIKYK